MHHSMYLTPYNTLSFSLPIMPVSPFCTSHFHHDNCFRKSTLPKLCCSAHSEGIFPRMIHPTKHLYPATPQQPSLAPMSGLLQLSLPRDPLSLTHGSWGGRVSKVKRTKSKGWSSAQEFKFQGHPEESTTRPEREVQRRRIHPVLPDERFNEAREFMV